MALVFRDQLLIVYKPVKARGALSLSNFPCFADILAAKTEMETMVNVTI